MPSFPWVDHAWLQSLFIGAFFPIIGKTGLSLIIAGLALSALFISAARSKDAYFINKKPSFFPKAFFILGNIPFILAASILLSFSGVRVQIASWVMLSLLLVGILDEKLWKKFKIVTPLFFLIWANLHGGFASGLAVLFLVYGVRSVRKRTISFLDLLILVLSALSTLATPYGLGTWREVYSSLSDSSLRWSISEWMPSFFMVDLSMGALIVLSSTLVFRYRRLFSPEEVAIYITFLVQGLLTRRHLPLWVIIALPMSISGIYFFYKDILKIKGAEGRFRKAFVWGWWGSLAIFFIQTITNFIGVFYMRENNFYPRAAVQYLRTNLPEGEIFSDYGWGGYLIWKLPEKKVFIDGRMPSWKWTPANSVETGNAFDDYKKILSGEYYFRNQFERYKVDTVLLPRRGGVGLEGFLEKKLVNLFQKNNFEFDLTHDLEKAGWVKVFEDRAAVVYHKS
jgi:hypothetical protein